MVLSFMDASLQTRLGIPMIYGVDAVHGHSNVVGAVIFPHNVGLGATRDADLVERVAQVTASEVLATNVHWDFAPAVSVPQDVRWGRSYEGFSENTELVTEMGVAYLRGLQCKNEHGEWVLASVKHFAGDGGTEWIPVRICPIPHRLTGRRLPSTGASTRAIRASMKRPCAKSIWNLTSRPSTLARKISWCRSLVGTASRCTPMNTY